MKGARTRSKWLINISKQDISSIMRIDSYRKIIEDAISKLDSTEQNVFASIEIQGKNIAEVAELLGLSPEETFQTLQKAKNRLQIIIDETFQPNMLFPYHDAYCNPMTKKIMNLINNL